MALRQMYDSDTEIPAVMKEHYIEKDGRWILETDPPSEDVSGLKNALNQERTLRRDTEKALSEWKLKYEGVDLDEYRKLQDRVKGLDDAEVYDRQGIEALITRRTENMKLEHERIASAKDREITQLKGTNADLLQRWKGDRIRTALLTAATSSGVHEKGMRDAVSRGAEIFIDLDEQGRPIAKNGDDVRYGKDGVNPLQPDEWFLNLKASGDAPHLWNPSGGSGAPAHHGGNGAGFDWNSIKDPAERITRFREAQAAGHRT